MEDRRLQAVERNEVITVAKLDAEHGVPKRLASNLPPGLWGQWTPLVIEGHPPAVLFLMGMAGESSPPEPSLSKALGRLLSGAMQNSLDYQDAQRQRDQLTALSDVGTVLLKSEPFEERLRQVAQRVVEAANVAAVTLIIPDPRGQGLILSNTYAQQARELAEEWERHVQQSERFMQQLRQAASTVREPFVIEEPAEHPAVLPFLRKIYQRGRIRALATVPLIFEERSLGLLAVISTERNAFDEETIALFRTIAGQIASAAQVALLLLEVQHSYEELRQSQLDSMLRLAAVAEARDPYTGNHLHRLRVYAEAIAGRLGSSSEELHALGNAAAVHDIGKLRIPDSILTKQGRLTEDEWALMRRHPVFGEELLGGKSCYPEASQVARSHHERWDGAGYPDGLKEEAIPYAARVISVADVFDALTSRRPYKPAWPIERAIEYIRMQRGQQFSPEVVDAFLELAQDGTLKTLLGGAAEPGLDALAVDERLVA